MKIVLLVLLFANIYVYYLLYTSSRHFNSLTQDEFAMDDPSKKDCSKCKWKLRKECAVVEGVCHDKEEFNNDEHSCTQQGYKFVPSGVISKLDSERCTDMFAHACFDENYEICNKDICNEDTWVPGGCTPYKEVGVCLDDETANNNPQECQGDYVVNGIIKTT